MLTHRRRRTGYRHHSSESNGLQRIKALLCTAVIAVPAVLVLAVTPGAAHATEERSTTTAARSEAALELLNSWSREWYDGNYDAYVQFWVWSDHRKHMTICDGNANDGIALAIQIDPSGPKNPIVYYDPTPGGNRGDCWEHDIWYSVRKFKWVSVYQGTNEIHGDALPWIAEYPFPDF